MEGKLYSNDAVKNPKRPTENSSSTVILDVVTPNTLIYRKVRDRHVGAVSTPPTQGRFCLVALFDFHPLGHNCTFVLSLWELFPDTWSFNSNAVSVAPSVAVKVTFSGLAFSYAQTIF